MRPDSGPAGGQEGQDRTHGQNGTHGQDGTQGPTSVDATPQGADAGARAGELDADVLVVGSGFGGSVAALRAVERGYRVLVLEAGRRFADGDFPKTTWDVRRFLWAPRLGCYGIQRMRLLRDVLVLSGAGVGGGSLVYANTLYVPPARFYDDPQWRGIADWATELAPHLDQAARMLGVTDNPDRTPADDVLAQVAQEMGVGHTFRLTPVGVFFGTPDRAGTGAGTADRRTADPGTDHRDNGHGAGLRMRPAGLPDGPVPDRPDVDTVDSDRVGLDRPETRGADGSTASAPHSSRRPGATVADPFFGGAGPARSVCTRCGSCMSGCRVGAKNTLPKNYLWLAEHAGVRISPLTTVTDLRQEADGTWLVRTVPTGASRNSRRGKVLRVREVVLAAGALGTQTLLQRLAADGHHPGLSRRVGELTRTNSEAIHAVVRDRVGGTAHATPEPATTPRPATTPEPATAPRPATAPDVRALGASAAAAASQGSPTGPVAGRDTVADWQPTPAPPTPGPTLVPVMAGSADEPVGDPRPSPLQAPARPGRRSGGGAPGTADHSRGIAISSSMHPDDHTHVEPCRYGRGSNLMALLGTLLVDGDERRERIGHFAAAVARHPVRFATGLSVRRWSERGFVLLTMQSHDNSITVSPGRTGRLTSRPGPGVPSPRSIPQAHEVTRRVAAKIGGRAQGSWTELADIPVTAHILGGAVIGEDAEHGVVDGWQRVFGASGLHVLDGAAVSANLGVNPSLTITAQAERAMSYWPNAGGPEPRPPVGSPYAPVRPVRPLAPTVPAGASGALRTG